MLLSGSEIIKQVNEKNIYIEGFDPNKVGPNSYNLTLHDELLIYKNFELDARKENPTERIKICEEGFLLLPGVLYLGRVREVTETSKFAPMLEGRSSTGRLGLDVHVSAGVGDVGFDGYWTLELRVVHPLRVYPGMEVCQVLYHTVQGDTSIQYRGKYQGNRDIQASRLYRDFK